MDALSPADIEQLAARGISADEARRQLALLRQPPPYARVLRPATVGDGIHQLDAADEPRLLERYDRARRLGQILRFVPASGAASRMFKVLEAYRSGVRDDPTVAAAERLAAELDRFPFAAELRRAAGLDGGEAADPRRLIEALLGPGGLDYGRMPKGLVPFHRYTDHLRTAFEEHLVATLEQVRDGSGAARVHFTVSPEHEERFTALLDRRRLFFERRFEGRLEVAFSHQHPRTDTLAIDDDQLPVRREDGSLLLRPGGHGALIENLAALGTPVVLIRNIDNVLPDGRRGIARRWSGLLCGLLLELQDRVFDLTERLETAGAAAIGATRTFVDRWLGAGPPAGEDADRPESWLRLLRRPLRVCGMVRNEGQPGGGPFWVLDGLGRESCQIVEGSQIDPDSGAARRALAAATHFNPVDLACALVDRHRRPYRLEEFVDPATAFVSTKSFGGRSLRALERPGLWNGAMAYWNTVFVEVPAATFAPVKTVFDLLRDEHQEGGGR
ncbi:MAG: DUF4301 family protein [Acidobacteriota bacterium]|nr:DUF4301 family protein [Acidobacteriota bacterium]